MTISIEVKDRDGNRRTVDGDAGDVLMNLLRDQDFGIEGTCGGMSSCGSCHVYAGGDLLSLLDPADEDETDMLEALADAVEVKPESRLSCQVKLAEAMAGTSLEIAPQL